MLRSCVAVAVACMLGASAQGYTITAVTAPAAMTRPADGFLYPFVVTLTGAYGVADLGGWPTEPIEFWDEDTFADDPIQAGVTAPTWAVPPGPIGAVAFGPINVTMFCGCTTAGVFFGPEVRGPSGNTGENPMADGYIYFANSTVGARYWGYITVTCTAVATAPVNGAPAASGALAYNPQQPWPCPGDLNHDYRIDSADLGIMLASWQASEAGDVNGDDRTDSADLGILLANWQMQCTALSPIEVPASPSLP
ncbi:MAG: hypothetical protein U1D55_10065 [Phycisphaerae bacterium]